MYLLLECAHITCAVAGETCSVGLCRCGTEATCEGGGFGEVCDVANNACKCGSLDACVYPQTCYAGACVGN